MMKIFSLAFTLLFLKNFAFSQIENTPVELINGKKYYVHIVQGGNTLYGIQKLYQVPVEDLIKENKGLESGLKEGQKLLIPVKLYTVKHVVEKKETIYSIAKKYNVSVVSIIQSNPAAEKGIQIGQVLEIGGVDQLTINQTKVIEPNVENPVVPKASSDTITNAAGNFKISFSDSIINHTVLDHETLYSISKRFMVTVNEIVQLNQLKQNKIRPGDVLKIPVKKEKLEKLEIRQVQKQELRKIDTTLLFPKKSKYQVAMLLPFYLDGGNGSSERMTTIATEFYMGAKLALDSLERLGLVADVQVFDTKNDTVSVKNMLEKPEFKDMDLIIGPLFVENMAVVAKWCKANKVRMICPLVSNPGVLKGNPYIYNAIPSDATLMKNLASHILHNNSGEQVILVKPNNAKDLIIYDNFRSTFLTDPTQGTRPKLIEASADNFQTFMKKGERIILVYPTNNKGLAIKFMNNLNNISTKYNSDLIAIYATKDWLNFDEIKAHYKNKFHLHFASPTDMNYRYEQTEQLHRKYRSSYNSDMTKIAVQGFDVTLHFCAELFLKLKDKGTVMNQFEMIQLGPENGFENSGSFILKHENFELINVGK